MSKNPLFKDLPFFNDLNKCGENVAGMTERIYQATRRRDDVYDQRLFIKKIELDPFKVDGFYIGDLFTPEIDNITLASGKDFILSANEMPEKYNHIGSLWQVSLSPTFATILKSELTNDVTLLNDFTFIFDSLPFGTDYYFRVRYNTRDQQTNWSNIVKGRTTEIEPIVKPTITGHILTPNSIQLDATAFENGGQIELPHKSSIWQISTYSTFTSVLFNEESIDHKEHIEINLTNSLLTGMNYYCRVKYTNNVSESEWSTPCTLSIANIEPPEILTATLVDPTTFFVAATEYEHSLLTHTETTWEISTREDFASPVINLFSNVDLIEARLQLNEEIVLDDDIVYYIRAKFHSNIISSEWGPFKAIRINNIAQPAISEVTFISNNYYHIVGSPYSHVILPHKKTTWQYGLDPEFNTFIGIVETEEDLITLDYNPTEIIEPEARYYFRVRYHSDEVESEWSDPYDFIIPKIETPIINVIEFDDNYDLHVEGSNFVHPYLTHSDTDWMIATDIDFIDIIFDHSTVDLTAREINLGYILPPTHTYFFKIRYHAEEFTSDWSIPKVFVTPDVIKTVINNHVLDKNAHKISLNLIPFNYLNYTPDRTIWEVSYVNDFATLFDSYEVNDLSTINDVSFTLSVWEANKPIFFRAKQFKESLDTGWSEPYEFNIPVIAKPLIESVTLPTDSYKFNVVGSPYVHATFEHIDSVWEVSYTSDFATKLMEDIDATNLTSNLIDIETAYKPETDYYFRVKYRSIDIVSEYSDNNKYTTPAVVDPIITACTIEPDNHKLNLVCTPFNFLNLVPAKSTWEISTVEDFSTILDTQVNEITDTINSISFTIATWEDGTTYYIRMKQERGELVTDYSNIYTFEIPSIEKPIISAVTITDDTFNFNIVSSLYTNTVLPHKSSKWEVSYTNDFAIVLLAKTSTTELTTGILDLEVDYKPSTDYYFRVTYNSVDATSDASDTYKLTTNALPKPEINSYIYNSELKKFNLASTNFNFYNSLLTKAVWEASTDNTFATIVSTQTIETPNDMLSTSFIIDPLLDDTNYYFRVKQYSNLIETDWSNIVTLKTPVSATIETPTILTSGTMCINNFLLESSSFSKIGDITQTKTIWQLCENDLFVENDPTLQEFIVDAESEATFTSLLIAQANLTEGKQYYIRVKYLSEPTP